MSAFAYLLVRQGRLFSQNQILNVKIAYLCDKEVVGMEKTS